ncbi:acyltransferase [Priestia megaterium]|uniref:Acyltransferase n=1 Tax=Priestia megaterium TaxID=1404 RepID=A0A6H1NX41_PRIMG|nr:acyltransferase [Priestia megaterium]QIZ05651.1 acyltransferase [Priestia megaterium]
MSNGIIKNVSAEFSNKAIRVSFIMVVFVIYIHADNLAYYGLENATDLLPYKVIDLLANGIGGIAVPFYFMLSGYWFFRFNIHSESAWESIKNKLSKRIFSILIPYLLWNTFGTIFYMVIPRFPFVASAMNGSATEVTILNLIKGIFFHAYYFPFWYLQDLIVLMALSPLFLLVLKRKQFSLLVLTIMAVAHLFNTPLMIIHTASLFFFYLGSSLAVYYRDWFEKRKGRNYSFVCLMVLILLIELRLQNYRIISDIAYLLSPLAMWNMFDLFNQSGKLGYQKETLWFEKQSFFIYASHIIIVTTVGKVLLKVGGAGDNSTWIIGNFIVAPFITLFVIYVLSRLLSRYCSRFYGIISGNRG